MKLILHFITFLILASFCVSSYANEVTYYGKVALSSTGGGKVYVSTAQEPPTDDQYAETSECIGHATQKYESNKPSSIGIPFYLFAQPEDGMMFDHWEENGTSISETNSVQVPAASENESDPTTRNLTAVFKKSGVVTVSTDQPSLGSVAINNKENKIGDKVKLTATLTKVPGYNCTKLTLRFGGWYDQDGNLLSKDPVYEFTADRTLRVKGVFEDLSSLVSGGYYRIRSSFNRVMTIDGSYSISANNDMTGLLSWTLPTGYDKNQFNFKEFANDTEATEVEAMPSTIVRIVGTQSVPGQTITDAVAHSQGTDTYAQTGKTFTIQPASGCPGYYEIINGSLSLKHGNGSETNTAIIMVGRSAQNAYQWMALQPLTEERIDEFWFGALPDESMNYDGGYWTSMYTSFPYECYVNEENGDIDGVEAYYVSGSVFSGGVNYVTISKIESGIVPAETPVLLKCKNAGAGSSKLNRLLPLDPDDSRIVPIEGNLLHGEYQLNKERNNTQHVTFDSSRMRIFGVSEDGVCGFYKMSDGTELTRNKVWLDISFLSEEARKAPMRMSFDDISGLDFVTSSETKAEKVIYDIYGRRVNHTEPGNIYIINGKKVVVR